jgi:hypothetical protein
LGDLQELGDLWQEGKDPPAQTLPHTFRKTHIMSRWVSGQRRLSVLTKVQVLSYPPGDGHRTKRDRQRVGHSNTPMHTRLEKNSMGSDSLTPRPGQTEVDRLTRHALRPVYPCLLLPEV